MSMTNARQVQLFHGNVITQGFLYLPIEVRTEAYMTNNAHNTLAYFVSAIDRPFDLNTHYTIDTDP
jgi:hypothetical protein